MKGQNNEIYDAMDIISLFPDILILSKLDLLMIFRVYFAVKL